MTASQASGTVKTARVLGHMPTVMDSALEGAVPHRSLQLLAQARNRHKIEFVDHKSIFGGIATYLSVAHIIHWADGNAFGVPWELLRNSRDRNQSRQHQAPL